MSAIDFANIDPTITPSKAPPPGVIPNFVDPPSNAHISIIVQSIMLPLMLAFVSLRVYSNLWISHKFALSDCEGPPVHFQLRWFFKFAHKLRQMPAFLLR